MTTPSKHSQKARFTTADIQAAKGRSEPLVCLTAYTAPMADHLDEYCDLMLVGDSVGMVLYGMDNTLQVDLDMMIRHGQAVMRRAKNACVVVDMPFGSYEESPEQAYRNAAKVMRETNCDAIKLEGGVDMAETIKYLTSRKIPVMGHIGLMPQSVVKDGGYKVKGKTKASEAQLLEDARAIEDAGVFAFVLEGTVDDVSAKVTQASGVPVIGIGASVACDGQILVTEDMLGMTDGHIPKFVKQYAKL
ncbi:MAG: 3-methyl-2-oxobutanoate hydroxymethyltransferase, partial [Pseudomonadota bacterium]